MKNQITIIILLIFSVGSFAQENTYSYWIEKGKELYDQEDYAAAINCFIKTSEFGPDSVDGWFRQGITYIELEDYAMAEKSFKKALSIDTTSRDCWNDLGFVYNRTGRYKEAIPCFQKTIELTPDIANPYAHLGYAYLRVGELESSKTMLSKAKHINSDYNKTFFYMACYDAQKENSNNALKHLEMAINKGFKWKQWIEKEPSLDLIRSSEKYVELISRL